MPLLLPPGPFAAYLFDCDGTIADSMPLHYLAWQQALADWSCAFPKETFPEETFYAWGGMPVETIIANLNRQHGLSMPVLELAAHKEAIFNRDLSTLQAVPEVLEHILATHGKIPFAVVSGGGREAVIASLETLGLLDRFDTLVCAEDYTHGKPNPEPFLLAAQRLNVPPAQCLVFEDTDLGIQAATAAGMASVKVLPPARCPR